MTYHVNPSTGNPGFCRAKKQCPFGDLEKDHYETKEAAAKAFEKNNETFTSNGFSWPIESSTLVFNSVHTPGGKIIFQVSDEFSMMNQHHKIEAWLETPGEGNVAFVSLLARDKEYHPSVDAHIGLCDIEVKQDQRGKGFGRELLESIEKETGLLIYASGSYTPEGWAAFGKHMRYLPGSTEGWGNEPGVKFNAMGFVASWKHRVPRYPDNSIDHTDEQREAIYELSEAGVFQKMQDKEILWATE